MSFRARVAGLLGPLAGGAFVLLALALGWPVATTLVGGAFVMLGGTTAGWAWIRFSKKEQSERRQPD